MIDPGRTLLVLILSLGPAGCADYAPLRPAGDAGPSDADGFTEPDGGEPDGGDGGGELAADGGDALTPDCPTYIGALAACAFQYVREVGPAACPRTVCLDRPCRLDGDCPLAEGLDLGPSCVTGNCVFCWLNSQCPVGTRCRMGRCVTDATDCPGSPDCIVDCRPIDPSERPCAQCACESLFAMPCAEDLDCLSLSIHPYRRCLYGRCAECRHDEDCDGGRCLPPGICADASPHPRRLYGAWLLGWPGGMDHYSYFRFEPDGTLRRAHYQEREGSFTDDIMAMAPCEGQEDHDYPLLGNWEVLRSDSGEGLHLRLTLNSACATLALLYTRAEISQGGDYASFSGDQTFFDGYRVPPALCSDDFATCPHPEDLTIWPPP